MRILLAAYLAVILLCIVIYEGTLTERIEMCTELNQTLEGNESDMALTFDKITKSDHKIATRNYHVNSYLYTKNCGELK